MVEVERRCPLCGKVMQDYARNLLCDNKRYNFPFRFYHCDSHGIYAWRGRGHELFDLNKRMNQVSSVEPLETEILKRFAESGSRMPTLSDYKPVKMKCPNCSEEWKQHNGPLVGNRKTVFCPWCRSEITKEKAIV